MKLNDITEKYKTDKRNLEHNYVQFYEKHFEFLCDNDLKLLEIGIYRPPVIGVEQPNGREVGASLKTWYDYFPKANILGVDLTDFTDIDNDRIKTTICNQAYRDNGHDYPGLSSIINKYGGEFDIIVDDGGHSMEQQLVTLGYMFKYLKPGGIFVVEDLHTSYLSPHAYNNTGTVNTTLKVLLDSQRGDKIYSEFMTEDELHYLNGNIKECHVYMGNHSEIAFIIKK
jgi:hypothetical protein